MKASLLHQIREWGTLITLVTMIVYLTWFIAGMHREDALRDIKLANVQKEIVEIKANISAIVTAYKASELRLQGEMNRRVERIEDKVDKIYTLVADNKK